MKSPSYQGDENDRCNVHPRDPSLRAHMRSHCVQVDRGGQRNAEIGFSRKITRIPLQENVRIGATAETLFVVHVIGYLMAGRGVALLASRLYYQHDAPVLLIYDLLGD